ncbi:MAG: hypothetical protein JWO28_2451 [Hyphomicrobiales bacterium]|nr:hypothetical protein [Hyphomicrobiales bacterium]
MTFRSVAGALSLFIAFASASLAQTAPANDPPQYMDEDFARDVQKAVSTGDAAWLADHARYPMKAFGKKQTMVIKNRKAFIASASKILGPKLKAAVLAQDLENLFRNYQGVMIGQIQNIWFYNISEGGEKNDFKIITINYDN